MASIRKPRLRKDGTYCYSVLYRMADGRQSSLPFDDPKAAELFRQTVEVHGAERALGMYNIDPAPRRRDRVEDVLTVAGWCRRHIDNLTGREQYTIDVYNRYLELDIKPTLGDIPIAALTEEDISVWVKRMLTEPSKKTGRLVLPKTIHNKHGFLSGALKAAVLAGVIPSNPAAGRRLPRIGDEHEMRMLSRDEFERLLAATTEPWRPFVEFLVASGCRWGEATALKPADVDREAGTVRIRRAWKYSSKGHEIGPPKTKRSRRTINVPAEVLKKLDYTRAWLFVGRDGPNWREVGNGPVRYQGFRGRVWDKAVTKAKLKPAPTPHDLRHTCASWMLAAGVPITTVSRHLGHENISVTVDIYADVDRASAAAAADVMGKLLIPRVN